jgi:hypothetical protein
MTGRHLQRSSIRSYAVLLALAVGSLACAEREVNGDDVDAEPIEHPPELLERYEQACEDWCMLVDECGVYESWCNNCVERDFSMEHVLCLEKAALREECKAALTCEEVDRLDEDADQDYPCYGEGIAESVACR